MPENFYIDYRSIAYYMAVYDRLPEPDVLEFTVWYDVTEGMDG